MVNDLIVSRSVLLNAEASRVWDILTNRGVNKSHMYDMTVNTEWTAGTPIRWQGTHDNRSIVRQGRVIEVTPVRTLQYSIFDPYSGLEDIPENYIHVTYRITPRNGRTELSVTLSNFAGDSTRAQLAAEEWDFNIIPQLKNAAEQRTYSQTIL
jgi:hypothetical protein